MIIYPPNVVLFPMKSGFDGLPPHDTVPMNTVFDDLFDFLDDFIGFIDRPAPIHLDMHFPDHIRP